MLVQAAGAVHSAGCMPEPQFPTCPGAPPRSFCIGVLHVRGPLVSLVHGSDVNSQPSPCTRAWL